MSFRSNSRLRPRQARRSQRPAQHRHLRQQVEQPAGHERDEDSVGEPEGSGLRARIVERVAHQVVAQGHADRVPDVHGQGVAADELQVVGQVRQACDRDCDDDRQWQREELPGQAHQQGSLVVSEDIHAWQDPRQRHTVRVHLSEELDQHHAQEEAHSCWQPARDGGRCRCKAGDRATQMQAADEEG